jgi:hypothetical protein
VAELEVLIGETVAAYEVAVAPTIVTSTAKVQREYVYIVREYTLPQLVLAAAW